MKNNGKILAMAVTSSLLLSGSNANALHIYSPYVEKGVMEIESVNRFDFDDRSSENNYRKHQLAIEYGFTSQWKAALYGEWEKENNRGYKYTATEIENIFQLTDVGEYWLDVGAQASYEFAHTSGGADKFETFLLLAKNFNKFTTIANIGLEQEVGNNANSNPEGELRMLAKYNYIPILNPAVEYHASFGEISDPKSYSEQKHRLGPVLYGKIGNGVKYELGTLFGISKAAEDYVIKFNLEYEFPLKW